MNHHSQILSSTKIQAWKQQPRKTGNPAPNEGGNAQGPHRAIQTRLVEWNGSCHASLTDPHVLRKMLLGFSHPPSSSWHVKRHNITEWGLFHKDMNETDMLNLKLLPTCVLAVLTGIGTHAGCWRYKNVIFFFKQPSYSFMMVAKTWDAANLSARFADKRCLQTWLQIKLQLHMQTWDSNLVQVHHRVVTASAN